MLDLGASPDYKDSRGLTPLYHSAMIGGDPYCCELLLYDHAQLGYSDENGWQEIHQVTRTRTHAHTRTHIYTHLYVLHCTCSIRGTKARGWCWSAGLSTRKCAAPRAPVVLRSWDECAECLRKHSAAPVCALQPGTNTYCVHTVHTYMQLRS